MLYEATGRLGRFANPDCRHWLPDLTYLSEDYGTLYLDILRETLR